MGSTCCIYTKKNSDNSIIENIMDNNINKPKIIKENIHNNNNNNYIDKINTDIDSDINNNTIKNINIKDKTKTKAKSEEKNENEILNENNNMIFSDNYISTTLDSKESINSLNKKSRIQIEKNLNPPEKNKIIRKSRFCKE